MNRSIILTTNDDTNFSKKFIVSHRQFKAISLMCTIGGYLRYNFDVYAENIKEQNCSNETLWNEFFNKVFQNQILINDYLKTGTVF